MLAPTTFRFLAVEHGLDSALDWNRPDRPKLWLYNLHYFDDLNADGANARADWHRALLERWIDDNPPAAGNGWEPYPVSLRIVNWVKWAWAGTALDQRWAHSLAVQARWLLARLEWHLLGNHLFANAKALVFAGTYFSGPEADVWRDKGLVILRQQLIDQILADGGHFERSPMYHAILCEDLIDLLSLARCCPGVVPAETIRTWREVATHMLRWLKAMTHPDGKLVQFNDTADGIAPPTTELARYASGVGIYAAASGGVVTHLRDTGYIRLERGAAVAFLDVAPIGPDHMPGHAHADTLTFELSLFGLRFIVDSGCSTYAMGRERLRQRGTAAHNTVTVDGADSSEVWASFRVARRASIQALSLSSRDDRTTVTASHNGYLRLPGRVIHTRRWTLLPDSLRVVDTLEGRYKSAVVHLLLHPEVEVKQLTARVFALQREGRVASIRVYAGTTQIESATWHPKFGVSLETRRITIALTKSRVATRVEW